MKLWAPKHQKCLWDLVKGHHWPNGTNILYNFSHLLYFVWQAGPSQSNESSVDVLCSYKGWMNNNNNNLCSVNTFGHNVRCYDIRTNRGSESPGRDFLRYSPASPCNPQGLLFYTKARSLLILSIINPYIPITNATVKPPLLQPIEADHHPKPHLVVTHMWLWPWPDTRRGFTGISDRFIFDPETMAQKVLVNTHTGHVSITSVSQ